MGKVRGKNEVVFSESSDGSLGVEGGVKGDM